MKIRGMLRSALLFLIALPFTTTADDGPTRADLEAVVRQVLEPACVESVQSARARIQAFLISQEVKSGFAHLTGPEVCGCVADRVLDTATPALVVDYEQFKVLYTRQFMGCTANHMRANIKTACSAGLGADYLRREGVAPEAIAAKLPQLCECIAAEFAKVSDTALIEYSATALQGYQARQVGNAAATEASSPHLFARCAGAY